MALLLVNEGTYTGSGVGRAITISDYQSIVIPQLVIVVRSDGNALAGNVQHCWRATGMTDSIAGFLSLITTGITALSVGGFFVGTHDSVNKNGDTYYWLALANIDEFGERSVEALEVGSYTGNGVDNRNITITLTSPDFVWVRAIKNNYEDVWRFSGSPGGDNSALRPSNNFNNADGIQAIGTNTFQVGTHGYVNEDTTAYTYVAMKAKTGSLAYGTYDGNGVDNRDIVMSDAFRPQAVLVKGGVDPGDPVLKTTSITGDAAKPFDDFGDAVPDSSIQADMIQAINSNGFQVGSGVGTIGGFTNKPISGPTTFTYQYLAFLSDLFVGPPTFNPGPYSVYIDPTTPYTQYKSQVAISERLRMLRLGN